jgi:hypothetical protein
VGRIGVTPRRRNTHPDAVIGAKPLDFCCWLFALLGATTGDISTTSIPAQASSESARARTADPRHLVTRCSRQLRGRNREALKAFHPKLWLIERNDDLVSPFRQ